MSRVVQISILAKVSGNVNADGVIGDRTTIKRMYSSDGEVLPFVSARSVKYAIRQALRDVGFPIDSYEGTDDKKSKAPKTSGELRLPDSANPDKYVDNDLFGFMRTKGRGEGTRGETYRRQSPVAMSYFKAVKDTPVKAEFAAKFPRNEGYPVPFEVEVAEFIGKLNVLIYDYIGDFTKSTTLPPELKIRTKLPDDIRRKRLSAFLDILLTPSYVLSRRTNSLNMPEYRAALVCTSDAGPLPVYQYLDYFHVDGGISIDAPKLGLMLSRDDIKSKVKSGRVKFYLVDYAASPQGIELPDGAAKATVKQVIDEACDFLLSQGGD